MALVLAVCMLGGEMSVPAQAQIRFQPGTTGQQVDLFRPAPRVLQQYLKRAEKAISEQDYRAAVELLGSILTGQTRDPDLAEIQQDYFIRGFADTKHRTSIKARALKLLGELPAEGRQWYELKFGTEAAQLVKRAVEQRDISLLHEVTRKYFHTQAGYDAAMLIGRWQLDHGHPLAAALSLKRLADIPHASGPYEPTLSLLLAASWLRAGMTNEAAEVVVTLKRSRRGEDLKFGGRTVAWFATDQEAPAWLEQNLRGGRIELHEREQQWIIFRGNPQRNGLTTGGFPLMHFRWRVDTVLDAGDKNLVTQRRMEFESEDRAVIPSFQPLAVGDLVIMRTEEKVFGVDLKTGKRVWNYPWSHEGLEQLSRESENVPKYNANRSKRREQLEQRLWDDNPYGQLASDGQRVFLLAEMGYVTQSTSSRQMMFPPNFRRPSSSPNRTNQLVACSLTEEGKLQWIVGGTSGEDEPRLAGAFFLGAPLPLMGQLFVMAEINGEIQLVVLDSATGSLQWSQQVAHVAELTIDIDPHRRLAGATPSFDDGILVCPTSAGACVALDLATRSLLWGYQYPAHRPPMNRYGRSSFPNLGERWVDSLATLAQGAVLLAPVESNQLHCLDLLTGRLRWDPIDRDGMLYIGGIHDGIVLLVGAERCRAIALESGEPVWESDLDLGAAHPSGRGFLTGEYYYLPTTTSELLKIDLREGKVVQAIKTDLVLGNLISYRDQIISLNVDWLSCYYQAEPLRRLVDQRLKQQPDDVWALLRQAELLLHDGKRDDAIAVLRKSYRLTPEDEVVKGMLVATMMEALREDFAQYRHIASDIEQLIDQPRQRLEYLRLLVDGALRDGEGDEAWKAMQELTKVMEADAGANLLGQLTTTLRLGPAHKVRFDRWMAARIAQLYAASDKSRREAIESDVRRKLEASPGDVISLRHLLGLYGAIPIGDELRLALAEKLAEVEEWRAEAELLISDLIEDSTTAPAHIQAHALALEVELLTAVGRTREAAKFTAKLLARHPNEVLANNKPAHEWAADKLHALQEQPGTIPSWPKGKVLLDRAEASFSSTSYTYAFRNRQTAGATEPGVRVFYDSRMRQVIVKDPYGHTELSMRVGYFLNSGSWPFRVAHRGHLTLINVGFEVLLIDRLTGRNSRETLRWRADGNAVTVRRSGVTSRITTSTLRGEWGGAFYRPMDQATKTAMGRVGPFLSHGIVYQKLRELVCVDPISGELLWSRGGFDPGCDIFGDNERLYVIEPDREEVIILRTWDGTELGRRPAPPATQRWMTLGGRVLTCRKAGNELILALRDLWEQEDVWQRKVPTSSLLAEVSDHEFAVADRNGKITIVQLADGKPVIEHQGDPLNDNHDRLYVMPSSRDYLIVLSAPTKMVGTDSFSSPIPWRCPLVTGRLLALDRKDGSPLWESDAKIAGYAVPLDQPAESPVLLLMRQRSGRTQVRSSNSGSRPSIICVDRRFGNALLKEETVLRANVYFIVVDPAKQRVEVRVSPKRLTFQFTDQPQTEKRTPLKMELRNTLKVSGAIENVGRIAEELFKGLGGKTKTPQQAPKPKAKPDKEKDRDKE